MKDNKIHGIIAVVILVTMTCLITISHYLDKKHDDSAVVTRSVNDTIKCVITDKKNINTNNQYNI